MQAEILTVKSPCYVILVPTNDPDMIIPARGVVEDVILDPVVHKYSVRVTSVYENIYFLRKHFAGAYFRAGKRVYRMDPPQSALKSVPHFNTWLCDGGIRFACDFMFVFRSKQAMLAYFGLLQDYFIVRTVRKLRDLANKREYSMTGKLGMRGTADFEGRMWAAFADRFKDRDDFAAWLREIEGPRPIHRSPSVRRVSKRRVGRG